MEHLVGLLKTLADPTRLRIVRLLAIDSLNVGELTRIVGLAQSSVSRQLGELRKAGIVRESRSGGYSYYELVGEPEPPLQTVLERLGEQPDSEGDLARLAEVQRERVDSGSSGGPFLEPGRSWAAWARGLRWLLPALDVVDFGCGDGSLTVEMARWARSVVALDRNPQAVESTRERVQREGFANVRVLQRQLERNRLDDASCDLVVVSHALHHCEQPLEVLGQAWRLLRPRGRVLVFELTSHQEEWVREKLGHRWLGFNPKQTADQLSDSGFGQVETEVVPVRPAKDPFRVFVATGVKA